MPFTFNFSNFGGFGQQGYGYKVDSLKGEIGEILGINQGHTLVVRGASALSGSVSPGSPSALP